MLTSPTQCGTNGFSQRICLLLLKCVILRFEHPWYGSYFCQKTILPKALNCYMYVYIYSIYSIYRYTSCMIWYVCIYIPFTIWWVHAFFPWVAPVGIEPLTFPSPSYSIPLLSLLLHRVTSLHLYYFTDTREAPLVAAGAIFPKSYNRLKS